MDDGHALSRRKFVRRAALGGAAVAAAGAAWSLVRRAPGPRYPEGWDGAATPIPGFAGRRPNIVLIVADDLGWGDLSCYGSQALRTPNLDRLASEGARFTDFHACDAVCTPSRAGLLTGRYPARMGLDTPLQALGEPLGKRAMVRLGYLMGRAGLLDLAARGGGSGLPEPEVTLAEALRSAGYATGMVGKWHLGDYSADPRFNPLRHGFDFHFGVPYSNDMRPLPVYRNEERIEEDVTDLSTLTGRYTDEALDFLGSAPGRPFFLYFAHTFPHRPFAVSSAYAGSSAGGLYGDVVSELDASVGRVLDHLDASRAAADTLVLFTSDNGPWYDGSPGPFRGRKGQAFEGGHRVPFLARAPGLVAPGSVCRVPATHLDVFPTCLAAAGLAPPADRVVDGRDITPLLAGSDPREDERPLYLYHQGELEGVRQGKWKYFRSTSHYVWPMPVNKRLGALTNHTEGPLPLLYDMETDPGEAYNLADRFPDVVSRLEASLTAWESEMEANPLGLIGR